MQHTCCLEAKQARLHFKLMCTQPGRLLTSDCCFADLQARQQQQQQTNGSERSLQETAAFLEGLFAASYAAQPLEDVAQCFEVSQYGPPERPHALHRRPQLPSIHRVLALCILYKAAHTWYSSLLPRLVQACSRALMYLATPCPACCCVYAGA
jgi:hypothetical protein